MKFAIKFIWKKLTVLTYTACICTIFAAGTKAVNVNAAEDIETVNYLGMRIEDNVAAELPKAEKEDTAEQTVKSADSAVQLPESINETTLINIEEKNNISNASNEFNTKNDPNVKNETDTIKEVVKKKLRPEYQIMVNRVANCVTVYEKDADGAFTVPVRAFVCSCGREGHETPLGTFKTSSYYKWRLMVDGTYGHYAVRFNQGIMFHSIPYYTPNEGDLEWDQFNLLGQPASLGCVRLACADAKWIYDNCKAGTKVIVYDDAENPGPLGKPEEIKVAAENPMHKWDPTDISAKNPWNALRPSLYLTNDIGDGVLYLPVGATPEIIRTAVGMKDALGLPYGVNDYKILFYGNFDLNTAGIYQVSVRGIGVHGVRIEQEMTVCVVG